MARKEKTAELPLVPAWLLVPLWCMALALPNLVYSGISFADTLHIMKWTVTGGPVAAALLAAGLRLMKYRQDRIPFRLDLFSVLWGLLLAYCTLQPLWVQISSPLTLIHELICFSAVWVFYILSVSSFPNGALRPLLLLANLNAALNVLFAELQIRGLNGLEFLEGTPFAFLRPLRSLILPTPGNYIGNTAQQNMFGLWMAICTMSAIYLLISRKPESEVSAERTSAARAGRFFRRITPPLLAVVLPVNIWGLWNSTSRSGILSLFVGLAAMTFVTAVKFGRTYMKRLGKILLLFALVLGFAMAFNPARSVELVDKTIDMVKEPSTYGGRIGIWTTTGAMFRDHPWGVGVGQYKWHYLEAQRSAFARDNADWHNWQYTHWAHNEFFQWFCEAGFLGGILLLGLFGLWAFAFFRKLFRGEELSPFAIWACSLVFLISFNAFWTRPFHRIENILWLTLAFALTNRETLTGRLGWGVSFTDTARRLLGLLALLAALTGSAYLVSGVRGNLILGRALAYQRQAAAVQDPERQKLLSRVMENLMIEAEGYPMVREQALRGLGYLYLRKGDAESDMKTLSKGFDLLWGHFRREPHSEDMSSLLSWAQRFQLTDVLKEVASYLKPGTFRLEEREVQDSLGRTVRALVLVPVRSSGGMQILESQDEGA